jgi:tetratricopeptide (TPR) repeat protein
MASTSSAADDAPLVVANVVAMRSREVGDYVYRVSQPSAALAGLPGVAVVTVSMLSPWLEEVLLGADVAVLHLLSEDDLFPLLAERKRLGRPTVYEISDNFLESHRGVGIQGWFADPANRANALKLIEMADGVQVTGPGLLARFGHLNPRTVVFRNQVLAVGAAPRPPGQRVELGWAGSVGHTDDLLQIAPVIAAVLARCPQARFAFMGNEQQFLRVFGGLAPEGRRFCPAGSLDDYYRFLETVDVGIAPLIDNPYNQCRSDIKFVEYASRGVVPVLAAVTPYLENAVQASTAFMFHDEEELQAVLLRLTQQPELRQVVAGRAQAYVRQQRLEGQQAGARLGFYQHLRGARVAPSPLCASLTGPPPEGGVWDLEHPAEGLLVAGIQAEASGDPASARERFADAADACPGYALPLFWYGRSHALHGETRQAERKFAQAAAANPRSVRALLELGRAQGDYDPEAAQATLERALALFPGHAGVLATMGALAERHGRWQQAIERYDQALRVNRFADLAAEGRRRALLRSQQA